MELLRARRLMKMLAVVLLSLALAACGANDGDEDPEETSAPSDAQPTVAANDEPTGTPPIVSEESTPVPSNIDMSSQADVATPQGDAPGTATPAPVTPEPSINAAGASPVASPAPDSSEGIGNSAVAGTDATPAVSEAASGSPEVTQGEDVLGDGTTGAVVDLPGGTPAATPAVETPATPGTSLSVTGCEVADVPPFQGEATLYQLTVDVNFRVGPGTDCDLVMEDPLGEFQQVEIIGGPVVRADDGSEWVQIQFVDSQGWVAFEFLEPVGQ